LWGGFVGGGWAGGEGVGGGGGISLNSPPRGKEMELFTKNPRAPFSTRKEERTKRPVKREPGKPNWRKGGR